jgi:deoxyribodipyrimidine photo-lyase
MSVSVMWFRRDLRLADNPALLAAGAEAGEVLPLFVLDSALYDVAGAPRRAYLLRSLRDLDRRLGGTLVVRRGDPVEEVPRLAAGIGASGVHCAADFGPYGATRDARVAAALAGIPLVRTGSPYAVAPGRVRKGDGTPYRVFTPFARAWAQHGWRAPAGPATGIAFTAPPDRGTLPTEPDLGGTVLPEAGEEAAQRRWADFLAGPVRTYAEDRDRPDLDSTSHLSASLKFGELHPRTLLAGLPPDADTYRTELCWREFYADVLHHRPESARRSLRADIPYDTGPDADALFAAWTAGRTGYPIVDAGMRQLAAEGWMHNRVRMITASFLVKDLHLPWWRGARYFLSRLVDGDLASNNHGWQWTAGTGTDAAPYHRIFNPATQGARFDPAGDYVRRYVPELRGIGGRAVHTLQDGPPEGYAEPIVDHRAERQEALRRYGEASRGTADSGTATSAAGTVR